MSKLVNWKALQPCVVAGVYHDAGEEFKAPDGDFAPDVRVKVDLAARTAAAPQGEESKTALFDSDPRVSARTADREVCDKAVKPLAKMNATELAAKAAELGLTFPADVTTNKDKVAYITAKQAAATAPGVTPDELPEADV